MEKKLEKEFTVEQAKEYIKFYEETVSKGYTAILNDEAKNKYENAKEVLKNAEAISNAKYNSNVKSTKISNWIQEIKYEIAMRESEVIGINKQMQQILDNIAALDAKSSTAGLTAEELKEYRKLNKEFRANQNRKTEFLRAISESKDELQVLEYSLANKTKKEQTSGIISALNKSIREYKALKKNATDMLKMMEEKKYDEKLINFKRQEIELCKEKVAELEQKKQELEKMSVVEYEKSQRTSNPPRKTPFAPELTGEQLIVELKKLNPDAEIEVESLVDFKITTTKDPKDLKLPEGFEYNEKNGITNKHKTQSGKYITCAVEKRERKTDWKLEELVEELKKLNPDAEIKLVGFVKPYIRTNAEPEKLKLPEGFSYTKEDGITNKGKTEGKVISCNIVQEKKKVEDESRIPFGQRFKVTKERKASIAKYAAAILKGAGVAALLVAAAPGIAFTGGTLLAGTAIGGGLAASIEYLLQKFYDGRKKEEDPDLKEGNIKGFFKKLKNKYKEYRKNKEQQKQEAEKREILADLEEDYLDLRNEIDAFLSENASYIIDADKEQMTALYKELKEAIAAEDIDLITEKIKTLDTEFFLLSLKINKQRAEAEKSADENLQEISTQDLNGEALDNYLNDINEMFLSETETAERKM